MTIDDPESQAARRATLENDRRLRESGSTYFDHASADADTPRGRYAIAEREAAITGKAPPPITAPNWAPDLAGTEPPLGIDINFVEPCGTTAEIEASLVNQSDNPESPTGVPPMLPPAETDGPAAPPGGSGPAPSGVLVFEQAGPSPFPEQTDE